MKDNIFVVNIMIKEGSVYQNAVFVLLIDLKKKRCESNGEETIVALLRDSEHLFFRKFYLRIY